MKLHRGNAQTVTMDFSATLIFNFQQPKWNQVKVIISHPLKTNIHWKPDETSHVAHVSLWKNDKPIPYKPQTLDPFCVDLF